MANAHRLITEGGWKSIPIMDLLYVVLGPYIDRVSLDGPNIDLEPDPVFNLSAALHELAANAIKHGSLSRSKGQLDLHWSVDRTQRGMTLMFDWVEKNGPSGAAAAAYRLWHAADRSRHPAAAQRRGSPHILAQRPVGENAGPADARALAIAGGCGRAALIGARTLPHSGGLLRQSHAP